MGDQSLTALVGLAAFVGFVHTLTGPDHYVPFVAMARARRWSRGKTLAVTLACGLGHVGSSAALGAAGIAFGWAAGRLGWVEEARGSLAGWLLLGFGLAYAVWGFRRAARGKTHAHVHAHADGTLHAHAHDHRSAHAHPHDQGTRDASITPWVLFTIFVLGPCEPLIPILMYPAAAMSWQSVAIVTAVFAAVTLATMAAVVLVADRGAAMAPFARLERYGHAIAGVALFACGVAIKLGL